MNRTPVFALVASSCLGLLAVSGCSVFKSNEEAQAIITKQVGGIPAGDFFDRYGRWRTRSELPSGATAYTWESVVGSASPGPYGLDDRVCKLSIIADKGGRIASAIISQDNPGRISTSRCAEMFKAP
ncbi:MAG: hypothetical protein ABI281_11090 [Caldimonas sp.]